jgi:hypothetical protein
MARFKRPPILFILLLVAFLLVLARGYFVESFLDAPVPAFCASLGFKIDEEQAFFNNIKDFENIRYYTTAQCTSLGGSINGLSHCVKEDTSGGTTDFSVLCAGLNKKATSTPEECGSYGVPYKAIKKHVIDYPGCKGTLCGKDISVFDKHMRSYTKDECTLLKGVYNDIGLDIGLCYDPKGGINYNTACASLNTPIPSISSVTDAGKSWMPSFSS